METWRTDLVKNLRQEMGKRGWTNAALSRATGITKATISNILTGKRVPAGSTMIKIAFALGIYVDCLLNRRLNTELTRLREFNREMAILLSRAAPVAWLEASPRDKFYTKEVHDWGTQVHELLTKYRA